MKYLKFQILSILVILSIIGLVSALTPDGSTPAGDNVTIFVYILFTVTTLGLFYSLFMILARLASVNVTIYDVLLSWASYILVMIVNHMSAHYLADVFTYDLTNAFLTITRWTNIYLPAVALIITIIYKTTQKKKNVSIKELTGGRLTHGEQQ